ncbi:hypothetical protein JG687_00018579 [Phytophthora cactorum]|uniref:BED-type domain-containing protein n=1 Tax=Phytophthora cactorum TaxID=29920 RepID=A0A8T1TP60_9STRA|nr:hypothetical protein JG687_00018579 [Phytophthora cactorum]
MKRQKKREFWQFIRLLAKDACADDMLTNTDADKAYCLKCRSTIDFKTGRHGVKQHTAVYHPVDLVSFTPASPCRPDAQQTMQLDACSLILLKRSLGSTNYQFVGSRKINKSS